MSEPSGAGSAVVHRQVWFGPEERPLNGWLCAPASGEVVASVLLCAAIGDEARATKRTFTMLAERLAGLGFLSLRFDPDGTGDSAGAFDDPEPAKRWAGSLDWAREHLESLGAGPVSAVGMRIGATLAATVAVETERPFASLVLWDPCSSGATFLREGEALYAFGERPVPPEVIGRVHTPGYHYDAASVESIKTLGLADLPPAPLAERTLLLTRPDRPFSRRAKARVQLEGSRLDVLEARGQSALLDAPPSESVPPRETLDAVVTWLVRGHDLGAEGHRVTLPDERPATIAVSGTSTEVREQVVHLAGGHVYGVATEPLHPRPGDAARPWVVLVNVATTDHTGPGREWVALARRWAALGLRCVRIDLSGCGDSPPRPGHVVDTLYDDAWLEDGREVVAELAADGSPVAMVGVCSGAYSAFEAATYGEVDAIIGINPEITLYAGARSREAYSPARRAARIPLARIARIAPRRRKTAGALWRIYRQLAFWHAPIAPIRRIVRGGTGVLLMGCRHDMRHYSEVAVWNLAPRPRGLRLVTDEAIDHPLLTHAGQERASELATAYLRERYGV